MESLHKLPREENTFAFDTVRGSCIEGRELYADAGFRELDHIQICVRSPKQIISYFWPREWSVNGPVETVQAEWHPYVRRLKAALAGSDLEFFKKAEGRPAGDGKR